MLFGLQPCSIKSRPYLADYDVLWRPKYLRSQVFDICWKSGIIHGAVIMADYSKHLEKQLEAQNRNIELPDYDFEPAIRDFPDKFFRLALRNSMTLVTRKFYEFISVQYLALRLCDRLTKDVIKSAGRKIQRFGQTWEVAERIFRTGCWSSILRVASVFTVDCAYGLWEFYRKDSKKKRFSFLQLSAWLVKRFSFHAVVAVWSSSGYAIGIYMAGQRWWVAIAMATIFEAGATLGLTSLLLN
jgi:hypothetical protein